MSMYLHHLVGLTSRLAACYVILQLNQSIVVAHEMIDTNDSDVFLPTAVSDKLHN